MGVRASETPKEDYMWVTSVAAAGVDTVRRHGPRAANNNSEDGSSPVRATLVSNSFRYVAKAILLAHLHSCRKLRIIPYRLPPTAELPNDDAIKVHTHNPRVWRRHH